MLKDAALEAIRVGTRAYMRSPWRLGKSAVRRAFAVHVGWRPYRRTVRTRFGDLMDIEMPDVISETIYLAGHWEPEITAYVRGHLRPSDTFVDVGANIGYYSILASGIVGATGKVWSIEAHPGIYARLKRNIEINGRSNVRAINAAAGTPGELPVFLGPSINPGHTTTVADIAARDGLKFDGMVRSDKLSSLVGADLYSARIIKIDVEGAEHAVVSPLFGELDRFSQSTEWLLELVPEYNGQAAIDEIYAAFRCAGYRAFVIGNYGTDRFKRYGEAALVPLTPEMQSAHNDVLMSRAL